MRRLTHRLARALGLPAVLIGLWWWASASYDIYYLPPPNEIVVRFQQVWLGPRITQDVVPSLTRLLLGLAVAIVLGTALGLLIGAWARLRALTEPMLEFLRAIPPPVLAPLLLLLAGVGDLTKVLMIVSGCLWPVLLNTIEGVRGIDPVLRNTCRSYQIHGVLRQRHLVLRAASPQLMTGVRQALPIGVILMVISEMTASSSGLGFTIVQFQRSFNSADMWTGVVLLGLLGLGLAGLYRLAEHRVLGWYIGRRS